MFNTQEKKSDVITGKIDVSKVSRGHAPNQSGSGRHKSKRQYKRVKKVLTDE